MDFPNGAPQSNLNEGEGEYMAASEITSKMKKRLLMSQMRKSRMQ
jgi:hypothetical protein